MIVKIKLTTPTIPKVIFNLSLITALCLTKSIDFAED